MARCPVRTSQRDVPANLDKLSVFLVFVYYHAPISYVEQTFGEFSTAPELIYLFQNFQEFFPFSFQRMLPYCSIRVLQHSLTCDLGLF
jgi:hypothetical protein